MDWAEYEHMCAGNPCIVNTLGGHSGGHFLTVFQTAKQCSSECILFQVTMRMFGKKYLFWILSGQKVQDPDNILYNGTENRENDGKCHDFFAPEREVWTMLKESGDKYIFNEIKRGIELDLPEYIQVGVDINGEDLEQRRARWNEAADNEYALPAEIWREVVDCRRRYQEIMDAIESGCITLVQDFVTYNLDICAFAQDLIDTVDDPAFIRAFYEVIKSITVLETATTKLIQFNEPKCKAA